MIFEERKEQMKEYQVSGELMKGFIGNIAYEVVLPVDMDQITVEVSFEKRIMEEITQEDREACIKAYRKNVGTNPEENEIIRMINGEKTEINVSVFHNEAYLGCAHRDEMIKKIVISSEKASKGFRTWKFHGGVLKVVLHVYQVLNQNTPYQVVIKREEKL